jgi:hypothetical protein
MSKRINARPRASQVEMGPRALEEYREIERRRSTQTAERVLEEAAPQFKDKGWTVTQKEDR